MRKFLGRRHAQAGLWQTRVLEPSGSVSFVAEGQNQLAFKVTSFSFYEVLKTASNPEGL